MITTTITGRIGNDAETKTIGGKEYAVCSVAAESSKDSTTWVKVIAYKGKSFDYLKKGAVLSASGRLTADVYKEKAQLTLWADRTNIEQFAKEEVKTSAPDDGDMPF